MILKGNQRTGGDDLASHLSNLYDNDEVELAEIRGVVAQDLHGAFAEFEAMAAGTRCKEPLYSLSINPSEPLTRQQYSAAIERIEQGLGLTGRPRAVIYHVKDGRAHCHVVWTRIDTQKMRAVQLSHDHQRLRTLSQELAQQFGHKLPEGLAASRGVQRFSAQENYKDAATLAQAGRSGLAAEHRRADITAAWKESTTPQAFIDALWRKGYALAQGDRRGFVVVDQAGEVHALARQIDGLRTKDLAARLAPLRPEHLPSVLQIRVQQQKQAALEPTIMEPRLRRSPDALKSRQSQRRGKMTGKRQELEVHQSAERMALHAAHKSEAGGPFARATIAVFGLFKKLPVLRSVIAPLARNPKFNITERHRLEREALMRRHKRERAVLEKQDGALRRVEARESRSLAFDQKIVQAHKVKQARARAETIYREIRENAADLGQPIAKGMGGPAQGPGPGHRRGRGYRLTPD